MAFTFQNMETPKAAGSWQEWSVPTVDSTSLDSIGRTYFFKLTKADTAAEIFSPQSTLGTEISLQTNSPIYPVNPNAQPWQVSIFLMIVLCYYVYVIFYYWKILPAIFRTCNSVAKTVLLYESRNNDESRLSNHSVLLVILIIATLSISFGADIVHQMPLVAISIVTAAATLLFTYKYILISIIGKFGNDKIISSNLEKINSHALTILAIAYTPVAIATSIDPNDNYTAILILAILWICYSLRLFKLFITSGFGKLQWILYLCAIEILPVSYLVTIAVRY